MSIKHLNIANKNKYLSIVQGWDIIGISTETEYVSIVSVANISATETDYKLLYLLFQKRNIREALEDKETFIIFSPSIFLLASTKVTWYNTHIRSLFEYIPFDPSSTLTRWTTEWSDKAQTMFNFKFKDSVKWKFTFY